MRLYHQPGSRSDRVLWALEEGGAPFEVTRIARDDKQTPEYLAIHPLGRSPGFEADGGPLFESAALCLFVADASPDPGLTWPLGSYERGLVYQWALFAATELEPPGSAMWAAHRASDKEAFAAAVERFRRAAGVLEQPLAGHEYLVGDRFSVADVLCADVASWGQGFDELEGVDAFDGLPETTAWLARCQARPAWQRMKATAS
jgi:glutathione S-transferase